MTIYNPIPICAAGQHPEDFTYRFHVIHYCAYDRPGNGLPMDAMSWWTLGIGGALCVILIIWIVRFMIVELKREQNL